MRSHSSSSPAFTRAFTNVRTSILRQGPTCALGPETVIRPQKNSSVAGMIQPARADGRHASAYWSASAFVYALRAKMKSRARYMRKATDGCLASSPMPLRPHRQSSQRRRRSLGEIRMACRQMLGGARWRPSRHQAVCVLKDVVAQFDRQRPARLSVAILNARRADRFYAGLRRGSLIRS